MLLRSCKQGSFVCEYWLVLRHGVVALFSFYWGDAMLLSEHSERRRYFACLRRQCVVRRVFCFTCLAIAALPTMSGLVAVALCSGTSALGSASAFVSFPPGCLPLGDRVEEPHPVRAGDVVRALGHSSGHARHTTASCFITSWQNICAGQHQHSTAREVVRAAFSRICRHGRPRSNEYVERESFSADCAVCLCGALAYFVQKVDLAELKGKDAPKHAGVRACLDRHGFSRRLGARTGI